jgi:hypothetical protein
MVGFLGNFNGDFGGNNWSFLGIIWRENCDGIFGHSLDNPISILKISVTNLLDVTIRGWKIIGKLRESNWEFSREMREFIRCPLGSLKVWIDPLSLSLLFYMALCTRVPILISLRLKHRLVLLFLDL